jgi:hypothetical protein
LHGITPTLVTSNQCRICQNQDIETVDHFVLTCPLKRRIWTEIWSRFFTGNFSEDAIRRCIFYISYADSLQGKTDLQLIASTMMAIWRLHWRYIFDGDPFIPHVGITMAINIYSTLTFSYDI